MQLLLEPKSTLDDNDFVPSPYFEEWTKEQNLNIRTSANINKIIKDDFKVPKENCRQKRIEATNKATRDVPLEAAIDNITVKMNDVTITNEKNECSKIGGASI